MAQSDTLVLAGLAGLALFAFRDDVKKVTGGVASGVQGVGEGVGTAFQGVGGGLSQVGTSIGQTAAVVPKRFEQVSAGVELIPSVTRGLQEIGSRELKESSELSAINQQKKVRRATGKVRRANISETATTTREQIKQEQKTKRSSQRQKTITAAQDTAVKAASDVKRTFTTLFRPSRQEGKRRREAFVSGAKSLKEKIFGKKIFGRG